jgi:PII-like signaling protein
MADVVATRLVVFLTEDDRFGHHGADAELLERARRAGIAGATVWRGVEGFGASGHLRTTRFPDIAEGLPLALEVVDAPERVDAFLAEIRQVVPGAFVTREAVHTVGRDRSVQP